MKTALIMVVWMSATGMLMAGGDDLIRFSAGDQLRGKFEGFGEGGVVNWRRDDVDEPVVFKAGGVRHVVLSGGKQNPLRTVSHLGLVNGDRIPGAIKSIDAKTVLIDTVYGGELRVPRDAVSLLAPNPFGGRLHYHGPFAEDEWKVSKSDSVVAAAADAKPSTEDGNWVFSGAAWYWRGERGSGALYRESCMPERSVLKFDLAWKSRLDLAVGFHLDFAKPKENDEPRRRLVTLGEADVAEFARLCGNGYILQLYPNYVMLYRCAVDDDGSPKLERFQSGNLSSRMNDSGRTSIEIRSHLAEGYFSLFIDGEFAMQWSEAGMLDDENGRKRSSGGGVAFAAHGENISMRISDIMVSEWNGMPDSARSMETEDQDVVLMVDGVDRYSGRVLSLDESGKLTLEARHGSFAFPLKDVAEIRFAKNRLARKEEDGSTASMAVRFSPMGVISGRPVSGNDDKIEIMHPLLGSCGLSLKSAAMLDFDGSKHAVDDWDDEF
ncbi:MAG: hypothetical protein RLZ22_1255 [Verrucomicrobiota bacterium]|jgi:hypothetical protein